MRGLSFADFAYLRRESKFSKNFQLKKWHFTLRAAMSERLDRFWWMIYGFLAIYLTFLLNILQAPELDSLECSGPRKMADSTVENWKLEHFCNFGSFKVAGPNFWLLYFVALCMCFQIKKINRKSTRTLGVILTGLIQVKKFCE